MHITYTTGTRALPEYMHTPSGPGLVVIFQAKHLCLWYISIIYNTAELSLHMIIFIGVLYIVLMPYTCLNAKKTIYTVSDQLRPMNSQTLCISYSQLYNAKISLKII